MKSEITFLLVITFRYSNVATNDMPGAPDAIIFIMFNKTKIL